MPMCNRRRKHKKAVLLVRNGNASYNTSEEMCNRMLFGFCFVDDDETTFFNSEISVTNSTTIPEVSDSTWSFVSTISKFEYMHALYLATVIQYLFVVLSAHTLQHSDHANESQNKYTPKYDVNSKADRRWWFTLHELSEVNSDGSPHICESCVRGCWNTMTILWL